MFVQMLLVVFPQSFPGRKKDLPFHGAHIYQ